MTNVVPLSDEEAGLYGGRHRLDEYPGSGKGRCLEDGQHWPCDAARALVTLRANREQAIRLIAAQTQRASATLLMRDEQIVRLQNIIRLDHWKWAGDNPKMGGVPVDMKHEAAKCPHHLCVALREMR